MVGEKTEASFSMKILSKEGKVLGKRFVESGENCEWEGELTWSRDFLEILESQLDLISVAAMVRGSVEFQGQRKFANQFSPVPPFFFITNNYCEVD